MTDSRPPHAWRFPAGLVALTAIWLAMLLGGNGAVDRAVYETLYAGSSPAMVAVARAFTALGEPTVLIAGSAIVAVVLWLRGHRRLAPVFFAITMTARIFSELQKYWIARVRPDFESQLVVVKSMSFPSGHATSSMVFYLTLALVFTQGTRWRPAAVTGAVLLSMLIGISRPMLGVHWPSDVVGGWAFGMLWVLLTLRIAGRWVKRA